jgi:hypothetical protein
LAPLALVAGTTPATKSSDPVIQLAPRGALFLFALGYFKLKALAQIVEAAAYFLTRPNPQAALFEEGAGRLPPGELAAWLRTDPQRLVENPRYWGACERGAVRRVAARVPEAVVNERRRKARAQAKKRGSTPSQAQLTLLAWNLFITTVSSTVGPAQTVSTAYSFRGQIERVFKSWKRELPLATVPTKTQHPTLCSL